MDDSVSGLFESIRVGDVVIRNRIAMAPMTRQSS